MYGRGMLRAKISHGWELLCLRTEELKNINHMHVTCVITEMVLFWWLVSAGKLDGSKACVLTLCLFTHICNFFVYGSKKNDALTRAKEKSAVTRYHGFELLILIIGGITDWKLILFHIAVSHILPLIVFGLQSLLLSVYDSEMSFSRTLRSAIVFLCFLVTFVPYAILVGVTLLYPEGYLVIKGVLLAVYLIVVMPLIANYEDEGENFFEFAYDLVN